MAEFSWRDLPDIQDVADALNQQGVLKARLRVAKLQLEIYQAELVRKKPRDSTVKLIGIDDASKAQLVLLFEKVNAIEEQLGDVEAAITFYNYRKEAAKIMSYQGRV